MIKRKTGLFFLLSLITGLVISCEFLGELWEPSDVAEIVKNSNKIPAVITFLSPAYGAITNHSSITVSGTVNVEAPATVSLVQVQMNDGNWSDATGTTSWTKTLTLADGTNNIFVRMVSDSGKTNISVKWIVVLDTTPPVVNIAVPSGDVFARFNDYLVSGTAGDTYGVDKVYLSLNNGSFYRIAGTIEWDISLELNGGASVTNTVRVYAVDNTGNISSTNQRLITVKNKLLASDGTNNNFLGASVAISADGDRILSGAEVADGKGAVYIFRWNNSDWEEIKLAAADGSPGDYFGNSVSASSEGDIVAVGAVYQGSSTGAAYVFRWDGLAWSQTNKILASDGEGGDEFGGALSLSADGNTLAVGAWADDNTNGTSAGAVYVYRWNGSSWAETKLIASNGISGINLGSSVSISADGNTVVSGADSADSGEGAVYVYRWDGFVWAETELTASDGGGGNNYFGISVSVSADGNIIAVGASEYDDRKGAVYVYRWNEASWTETKISASDGEGFNGEEGMILGDYFGQSISLSADGNTLAVGAYYDDFEKGSVYIYQWNGVTWWETKILPSDGAWYDEFGNSVAISADGNIVVGGAFQDNVGTKLNQGSASVYQIQ